MVTRYQSPSNRAPKASAVVLTWRDRATSDMSQDSAAIRLSPPSCEPARTPNSPRVNSRGTWNTHQDNIARLERGRTQATMLTLRRIASATGHRLIIESENESPGRDLMLAVALVAHHYPAAGEGI